MSDQDQQDLSRLTVDLLSAYFANNSVASDKLPALVAATRAALAGDNETPAPASEPRPVPAVSVEASTASRDRLLSLIDGKPYKSLKRHLSSNGLTPDQYRERYDLPADYPMVARSYSEHRSAVAKRMGLGGSPKAAPPADAAKTPAPKRQENSKAPAASKAAVKPARRSTAAAPAVTTESPLPGETGNPAAAKSAPVKAASARGTKRFARPKAEPAAASKTPAAPAQPAAELKPDGIPAAVPAKAAPKSRAKAPKPGAKAAAPTPTSNPASEPAAGGKPAAARSKGKTAQPSAGGSKPLKGRAGAAASAKDAGGKDAGAKDVGSKSMEVGAPPKAAAKPARNPSGVSTAKAAKPGPATGKAKALPSATPTDAAGDN